MSQILFAEPEGNDFLVKFDCGCTLRFWGEFGSEHAWTRCAECLNLPAYSPITRQMYDSSVKQRDAFNAARRRDEAEIVTR